MMPPVRATVDDASALASGAVANSKRRWLLISAITLIGALVRVFGLGSEPLWLDEAYTAHYTTLTPSQLWNSDVLFNNPPGYILLMKAWAQISRTDEWFRVPSVVAGVLTIPVIYLIGVRMGSRRAGLVAAFLFALAGYQVRYSQEVRAYSIVTLLVAIALLAVVQLITQPVGSNAQPLRTGRPAFGRGDRRPVTWTDLAWPAYGLAVGLALHMHNTSITIPIAASLGVGIWWLRAKPKPPRFIRNWILANAVALAVWAPWIPGFIRQANLVDDIGFSAAPPPSLLTVLRDLAAQGTDSLRYLVPAATGWWVDAIALAAIAVLVWLGLARMKWSYRATIVSFIVVHPLVELVASIRRPIFLARSLLWIAVATLVAIGFAVSRLRGLRLGAAVAGLALVPILTTVGYHTGFQKSPWDEVATMVAADSTTGDAVLVAHAGNTVPLVRYLDPDSLALDVFGLPRDLPNRQTSGRVLSESDFAIITDLTADRDKVWLLLSRSVLVTNAERLEPMLNEMFTHSEVTQLEDIKVIRYTN
jgi:uncharacterized membrane protein